MNGLVGQELGMNGLVGQELGMNGLVGQELGMNGRTSLEQVWGLSRCWSCVFD